MKRSPHRCLAKKGRLDVGSPEKEIWGRFEETRQTEGEKDSHDRKGGGDDIDE